MDKSKNTKNGGVYGRLLEDIFLAKYTAGSESLPFSRTEIEESALRLGVSLPKNLGDVIYSFRYRKEPPRSIAESAPKGFEWVILGTGRGAYRFKLARLNRLEPRLDLTTIKIPDATPEIIAAFALGDEQALLAKVRYNRLIDIFLGLSAFSLQNHLRTSVSDVGQIEIDEIYVALDKTGNQYVVPVQAKGGSDKSGSVQTAQDMACCAEKFPRLICRPVTVQFMEDDKIAMFELTRQDDEIRIVDEKHYRLVRAADISEEDLALYRRQTNR